MEVRWAVTVCMVRSDSFLFWSLVSWPGRSQPSFRGNVVVVGPMVAGRGSGKGSPGSSSSSLSDSAASSSPGSLCSGFSSHSSTCVITTSSGS
eukprot:4023181-Prymnesium_polylepis.1